MTDAASLVARLAEAVRRAVAGGEIGTAKSIRMHLGGPVMEPPDLEAALALGDAVFACARARTETMNGTGGHAALCIWEQGQIGTFTSGPSTAPLVVLNVLGQGGALHFQQGA